MVTSVSRAARRRLLPRDELSGPTSSRGTNLVGVGWQIRWHPPGSPYPGPVIVQESATTVAPAPGRDDGLMAAAVLIAGVATVLAG